MTFTNSADRTRNYLQQVKGAVVYRVLAVAASFFAIPLMIRYLGQEQFGVWSTLLTVISWVVFFDLGVGNGLRNKVAESLAKDQEDEARQFISAGYSLIGLLSIGLWLMATATSYWIPWQAVFNTTAVSNETLRLTVQIAVFFVVLNFWLGLISALLGAIQKTSLISLGQLVTNILALAFVFLLAEYTDASISYLALAYGLSIVVANCFLSVLFYKQRPTLRPQIQMQAEHLRPLLAVGLQFFVIQFAVLVIFTTDKMLITQLFGPQYVTQYEVVFKLFSVILFIHGLISAPLWSAYTDAINRLDFVWIRLMLMRQLAVYAGIVVFICLLLFAARGIIDIWIGEDLPTPQILILVMAVFVAISTWNNIFATLINGLGQIKVQLYISVVAMMINIPLSILLARTTGLGTSAVVLGTIFSLAMPAVALPIQVGLMIRRQRMEVAL